MRAFGLICFVWLLLCALAVPATAAEHWVLKPCGDTNGTCFQPVSYPVVFYFEADVGWGWGPTWDDGDGIPEGVILFPAITGGASWDKVSTRGGWSSHYKDRDMPFLWCDARYFPSNDAWRDAMLTWGFNLALLDIVNDLKQVWTRDAFKDLKGCWIGTGHYLDSYVTIDPTRWTWQIHVFGKARDSEGKTYDISMKINFQIPRDAVIPDDVHLVHMEFLSSPVESR